MKNIDPENIPENYKETVKKKILTDQLELGKIKYNDKILHQSKILKFYIENENEKKYKRFR